MNAPLVDGSLVGVALSERVTAYVGHVLDVLAHLEAASFHTIVTSPPYLWARDYGGEPVAWPEISYSPMPGLPPLSVPAMSCALGLEPTPEAYVAHLVAVFRQLRRVLRDDGIAWLNLGDTYASGGRGGGGSFGRERRAYAANSCKSGWRKAPACLKDKDLIGGPWRVAFALQADGWWVRSDVIWAKPNPMPESIEDRPTKSHEHVFLLAKSERYFYDADALREPAADPRRRARAEGTSAFRGQAAIRPRGPRAKRPPLDGAHGGAGADGLGARSFPNTRAPVGRTKRDVWSIATQPYHGAHFATMPSRLAELMVRAGTSVACCAQCGAPWERLVEITGASSSELERERGTTGYARAYAHYGRAKQAINYRGNHYDHVRERVTRGWAAPWCGHAPRDPVPCRVLDPFGGSGTTGATAHVLGRDAVLIDAQSEYLPLQRERIADAIDLVSQPQRRARAKHAAPEQLPLIGVPT